MSKISKTPAERTANPERASRHDRTSNPSSRSERSSPTYQNALDRAFGKSNGAATTVFTKPAQELQQAHQPQTPTARTTEAADANDSGLPPERIRRLRAQLEARARELVNELRAIEEDRPATPTLTQTTVEDMAEQGEQRSRDAVRGAEQDRDAGELRDIAAALARIDEGRYGICTECGTQIPFARLNVQPSALRCIECQQRYERAHPPELKTMLMR